MIDVTGVTGGDAPFDATPTFWDYETDVPPYVLIGDYNTAYPGPSGDVWLCTIEFDCLAEGVTTLILTVKTLSYVTGPSIPNTTLDGTVTQTLYVVETAIDQAQCPVDDVVIFPVTVLSVVDPGTGSPVTGVQIADYSILMEFTPGFMEILDVRGGDAPFDTIPPENIMITNGSGIATVSDDVGALGVEPQIVICRIVARLIGCNDSEECVECTPADDLHVTVVEVSDPSGGTMNALDQPMILSFWRGDVGMVYGVGEVNIADAMFGAQYLVWPEEMRPEINLLNFASAYHDDDLGTTEIVEGDQKTFTDCMYIAQFEVGMRDCYFEWALY